MKDKCPATVDGFRFLASADDPKVSYKMDKQTYDMLTPFGIVARTFRKDQRQFDVVLIAGNDKERLAVHAVATVPQDHRLDAAVAASGNGAHATL